MLVTMAQVWTPIDSWYQLYWLIPNSIIKNCEICYAWCQSLAFLLLLMRLKAVESQGKISEAAQKRNYRIFDIFLIAGLVVCNSLFLTYVGFLVWKNRKYSETVTQEEIDARNNAFVELEVVCSVVDICSAFLLLASAAYTIYMLRTLFGNDFNREARKMTLIAMIFCLSFLAKVSYQWTMFYMHTEGNKKDVFEMLRYQAIVMPLVWDVIPLTTIFILHL